MDLSYPTTEKLKSRKTIDLLFSGRQSVGKYPLRLAYVEIESGGIKMGVSVSKKYFKRAVDRNYFKRVLRETYRHNKHILTEATLEKSYAFMLLYQSKDRLTFEELNLKTVQLFEKFIMERHTKA